MNGRSSVELGNPKNTSATRECNSFSLVCVLDLSITFVVVVSLKSFVPFICNLLCCFHGNPPFYLCFNASHCHAYELKGSFCNFSSSVYYLLSVSQFFFFGLHIVTLFFLFSSFEWLFLEWVELFPCIKVWGCLSYNISVLHFIWKVSFIVMELHSMISLGSIIVVPFCSVFPIFLRVILKSLFLWKNWLV